MNKLSKLKKKIADKKKIAAFAVGTAAYLAYTYIRRNDVTVTAADAVRLNLGQEALIFEIHGSEFAIVPARFLKK